MSFVVRVLTLSQLRFCLSSMAEYGPLDGDFSLSKLNRCSMDLFKDRSDPWVVEILEYFNL